MMTIGKKGIELIKRFEGLRLKAYYCPANVLTIGYGHTGSDVYEGQALTELEAEQLLINDLVNFSQGVKDRLAIFVNQYQFDALVSFAYNVGLGAFERSTLLKKVNANKLDYGIKHEFKKWVYANGSKLKGLEIRREAEADLYFTPIIIGDNDPKTEKRV